MYRYVTRSGCKLCEEQERYLWALSVPYERVDVDAIPALTEAYGARVPVLLYGDEVVLEGRFTEADLARALGLEGGR
ncbi:glutaredoxin family protein [Marinithermus hydrothermalis]|uniref:Glutaredoxin 2 n=1 Tax=Marinithermus hydrothermalis (strain DSM 14884 / JCM 11576 / T1) TaxID=869210 RepID=F2NLP7_MARHT|nr:glutaredoxin family protein [Marinithermus hydrothermalis]AEB10877.1 glutaredoxin 2 [Marinithermus hydrothermalis DSM 14884]